MFTRARQRKCVGLLCIFLMCCRPATAFMKGFLNNSVPVRRRCGDKTYNPKSQSCCNDTTVNPVPDTQAQCCGTVAYWRNGDASKPENCTKPCGAAGTFHPLTELCCGDKPVWVGRDSNTLCCGDSRTVYDTRTHDCCGQFPIPKKTADYGCCGGAGFGFSIPYLKGSMKCTSNATSREVTMKTTQRFSTQQLCEMKLRTWDDAAPLPPADHHSLLKGWAQKCEINIVSSKSGRKIHIHLTPYFLTGTDLDPQCADSPALRVIIKISRHDCDVSRKDLQAYLYGMRLDFFFRKRITCVKGLPTLRLRKNNNAVLYGFKRSAHSYNTVPSIE